SRGRRRGFRPLQEVAPAETASTGKRRRASTRRRRPCRVELRPSGTRPPACLHVGRKGAVSSAGAWHRTCTTACAAAGGRVRAAVAGSGPAGPPRGRLLASPAGEGGRKAAGVPGTPLPRRPGRRRVPPNEPRRGGGRGRQLQLRAPDFHLWLSAVGHLALE